MAGLRVAVVSYDWSGDVRTWSGTPFHMALGFQALGCEVVHLGPLRRPGRRVVGTFNRALSSRGCSPLLYEREPLVSRMLSREVDRLVDRFQPDVLIAPGTVPVSRLQTTVPIVLWLDATITSMVGYYPSFAVSARSYRLAQEQERAAIDRAALTAFSSEWALQGARRALGEGLQRSIVVPFGANLTYVELPPPRALGNSVRLLLMGVDWHRKGVDTAIEAVSELRRRGLAVHLDVVGAAPPYGYRPASGVTLHPFISKTSAEGTALLNRFYHRATAFILPTRYDCLGVVLAEAAAHGLPLVATDTGGVSTMVQDGITGSLVPPGSPPEVWADSIASVVTDGRRYAALAAAARRDYETRLNWRTAAESIIKALGILA